MGVLAAAAAVIAALLGAARADARDATELVVTSGDAVTVQGSHVACDVGPTHGSKGITCFYEPNGHRQPGTWWVGLTVTAATLGRVKANGGTSVVLTRGPSVHRETARTVTAKVGDSVVISGTKLSCAVGRAKTFGVYIACSPDTRGTIYGVGIADRYAYLSRFRDRSWQNLKLVRQPA